MIGSVQYEVIGESRTSVVHGTGRICARAAGQLRNATDPRPQRRPHARKPRIGPHPRVFHLTSSEDGRTPACTSELDRVQLTEIHPNSPSQVEKMQSARHVPLMITAKHIRDLMQAKPFHPFRICLSDGTHYDITNHDMALVGKNIVEVGLNLDADGFAEHFARCSILHITKLEDLPATVSH